MTISVEGLDERKKNDFRVVLVPQCSSEQSSADFDTKLTTVPHQHPITGRMADFVVKQENKKDSPELLIMDRINWKNPNVKNQSYTPDGKPYRCLFVTQDTKKFFGDGHLVPATVLGTEPDIHALTRFSPLYFLLSFFNPLLRKNAHNGKDNGVDHRMSSFDDLLDEICEKDEFLGKLVQRFNFDLKPYLDLICETTPIPSIDSDDEDTTVFYRPSIEKIKQFLSAKINGLTERFMEDSRFKTIKVRWETMYPDEIPQKIKLLMCTKQTIVLLSNYVDKWYLDQAVQYDFTELEKYMLQLKERENAENLISESIQQLHEGTAAVLAAQKSKKLKTTKKQGKTVKNTSVAVGKGALDMFFKKKE